MFFVSISFSSLADKTVFYSFSSAKNKLEREVYAKEQERLTLYCQAAFDRQKNIIPPKGFESPKYKNRSQRVEWEHVVPAENFGRNFKEWREGHKLCVDSKGKSYKGRRCAEKVNSQFKHMQADMYNLYPAIGSVNASRRHYTFVILGNVANSFGSCGLKIENHKVEPPEASRGMIARAYLYMDNTYERYQMSHQQRQLMLAWHHAYPVNQWECERTRRIKNIQRNDNFIVQKSCEAAGYYH